ncbi:M20/M25/M40 family metallo-hydrolase [Psychroflexus sediminis]|uniref:Acetylornithine deacetylase/Succinyl-diaminopimelate desuccinylase n=1 Tax=Psychroflexus sediminis TaxID=470826 RepID=A0A1G7V829_9FLAO|nr:M20/M25/M40 family metallo-hydrolase [Psychroflexus sediminis]SDG55903.1 Acetylornithine deacetylase/Succinyl-diaminopimelate desuccinylase [Psychroflexus sediminis]
MKSITLTLGLLICCTGFSQTPDQDRLEKLADQALQNKIELLKDWLSIPNNGLVEQQVQANLNYAQTAFETRGFKTRVLETEATPLLLAERFTQNDLPTLLLYAHADGQPVEPERWNQPNPYEPVLKQQTALGEWEILPWSALQNSINPDWRIYGRSTSDDKGPIAMLWSAIDLMDQADITPKVNLKVIIDFEEELGSPNLPAAVKVHKEKLAADMLVILDGPQHSTNRPTLSFGARGIQTLTLTTYGPKGSQHSGHYGNYITNPARQLSQLLASFYTEDGRVAIPGYYEGVAISAAEMAALKNVPDNEVQLKKDLGYITRDSVAGFLQASIQYPSLNIRGLKSGWVGDEARTIVPDKAVAELDIRLVKSSQPAKLIERIQSHIEQQGYTVLSSPPNDEQRLSMDKIVQMNHEFNYDAFKTDIDSPVGEWLTSALERAFNTSPVIIPTSGGSIPISPFVSTLNVPAVTVPVVNNDNNQHSPNENIRIGHYRDGIISIMAILTQEYKP